MQPEEAEQSRLDIETRIHGLVGLPIRVLADAIPREHWEGPWTNGGVVEGGFRLTDWISMEGVPLFVEGVLQDFLVDSGEIDLHLSPLPYGDTTDSNACFRGTVAVIIGAPATVSLEFASRHFIERLPMNRAAYLEDLHSPNCQFEFDFVRPQLPP